MTTYNTEDLIELLELPEEYSMEDVKERCTQYIEKYKTSNPALSKFFLQAREYLLDALATDTETSSEHSESAETDTEQEPPDGSTNDPTATTQIQHAQATLLNGQTSMVGQYPLYERHAFYANNPHSLKSSVQSTYPSEVVPGSLNPLYRKTFKRMIVIDSKYREKYFDTESNNFYISFPEPVKNVISMTVSNVDIINAHYTVSALEGTNFMRMTLIPKADGQPTHVIPIQLEPGNMFSEDMSQKINEQIRLYFANQDQNTAFLFPNDTPNGNASVIDQLVKCSVSTISGRTTFTVNADLSNSDATQQFKEMQLDFTNPISEDLPPFFSLGWTMGFRNRYYKGARTYKSESIFNASGRQAVYLAIDDFQNHQNERISILHQDTFFSKNIAARVPLKDGKFTITFNDLSDRVERTREYYGPVDLQRFHVQLFDEFGELFDNNNMDFNFIIEIEVLYQG